MNGTGLDCGGGAEPGVLRPGVARSRDFAPLFLATLERGGVGNVVLSDDSNLASRLSIALMSKSPLRKG
jgi:hypothetical protein